MPNKVAHVNLTRPDTKHESQVRVEVVMDHDSNASSQNDRALNKFDFKMNINRTQS
jgi:hypothetical protein